MDDDTIRVLIVDDNAEFRAGLRGLLEVQPDLVVVGEAITGETALAAASRLQPDIILMDLQMPDLNGIEATRQLTSASPHIGVLVMTMSEDDASVFAAMRSGARGYLLKGARKAETLRAIHAVADGEVIFSPTIARRMMGFFAAVRPPPVAFPALTEREVLTLVAQGLGNREIADRLFLSLKTVRHHLSGIYGKMQMADRTQAALRAREAGLGKDVE